MFRRIFVVLAPIVGFNGRRGIGALAPQLLETTFHLVLEDEGGFSIYTKDPQAVEQLWQTLLDRTFVAAPTMDRLLGSGIRLIVPGTRPLGKSRPPR